jgi:carboxymethylenebutenolidase
MSMTEVQFQVGGERPRKVRGAFALPSGETKAPGVIVVQEWWGLNEDMRRIAERFSEEGFAALAVDLYDGKVATEKAEAFELMQAMKTSDALSIISGAAQFLRGSPRCTGKIGVTGFCLGGGITLAAACNVSGLSAAAPFYGIPLPEYADWSKAKIPISAHFGKNDGSIPVSRPEGILEAVRAAGGNMTLHLYDAGHAFMRVSDAKVYDEPSAKLAWQRVTEFFRRELGTAA